MKIKLSVVIAAYNVENYIIHCLKSLHEMQDPSIEFLIINDGSTDLTKRNIKEYLNRINDDRFYLFNRKNYGLSSTRNFGISKSRGEYILFVDGDDYFINNRDMGRYIINQMESYNLDILEYNFYWEKNHQLVKKNYLNKDLIDLTNGTDFLREAYVNKKKLMPQTWKFVFRKTFITENKFQFTKLNASEDVLWIWQLLNKAKRVKRIDIPYYVYVSRGDSIMHNFDKKATVKRSQSEIEVKSKIKKIILNLKLSSKDKDIILSTIITGYISSVISGYANGLKINRKEIKKFIGKTKINMKNKVKLFVVLYLPEIIGRKISYIIWNKRIKQL